MTGVQTCALPILTLTSGTQNQTVCSTNGAITSTVYTWGGGATSATATNLPAGLTQTVNSGAKTITISGTATTGGTYTITTSGELNPCTSTSLSGTITYNQAPTITLTSGSQNQSTCSPNAITNTVYTWGGSATSATATGLPAGLTQTINAGAKTITISGIPTAGGTYTVSTTGSSSPCSEVNKQGTITYGNPTAPTINTVNYPH